jgi:hypothetical protein
MTRPVKRSTSPDGEVVELVLFMSAVRISRQYSPPRNSSFRAAGLELIADGSIYVKQGKTAAELLIEPSTDLSTSKPEASISRSTIHAACLLTEPTR